MRCGSAAAVDPPEASGLTGCCVVFLLLQKHKKAVTLSSGKRTAKHQRKMDHKASRAGGWCRVQSGCRQKRRAVIAAGRCRRRLRWRRGDLPLLNGCCPAPCFRAGPHAGKGPGEVGACREGGGDEGQQGQQEGDKGKGQRNAGISTPSALARSRLQPCLFSHTIMNSRTARTHAYTHFAQGLSDAGSEAIQYPQLPAFPAACTPTHFLHARPRCHY